jgi:hypothetical protein
MGQGKVIPPPPPGFQMVPPPPDGFVLDTPIEQVAPEVKTGIALERPNVLERIGRGYMDVAQGIKQTGLMVTDLPAARDYTKQVNEELRLYDKGAGSGVDLARGVGAAAPYMAAAPFAPATLGGQVALGAGTGAISGMLGYSPTLDPMEKVWNAGLGAAVGGATSYGANKLTNAGTNAAIAAAQKGKAAAAKPFYTHQRVVQAIEPELKNAGIDWQKLSTNTKLQLLQDAQRQLSVTGKIDPASLIRKIDIEAIGAKGTVGSITRDPRQWTFERNTAKLDDVGDPLLTRFKSDNAAMIQAGERLVGKSAKTDYAASQAAIKSLRDADAKSAKVVDDLYEAYRATGKADKIDIPDVKIADALGRVVDEFGPENIPPAVLNRLKQYGLLDGTRTKALTIQEADKLNRLINNNNPGDGPSSRALGIIKQSINEALLDVPDDGTSQALLTARKAAAARFAEQRSGKAVTAAMDNAAPDKFFDRYVINGDVREVLALKASLSKAGGNDEWNGLRSRAAQWLLDKATNGDAEGQFSGARLKKAVDALGEEKLKAVFSPEEYKELMTLTRASVALTKEVPFSGVNHSNTAPTLTNLLGYVAKIPFVGPAVAGATHEGVKLGQSASTRRAVEKALSAAPATTAAMDEARRATADALARRVAPYAPALATALGMKPSPPTK